MLDKPFQADLQMQLINVCSVFLLYKGNFFNVIKGIHRDDLNKKNTSEIKIFYCLTKGLKFSSCG